jgi:hypothetical protein
MMRCDARDCNIAASLVVGRGREMHSRIAVGITVPRLTLDYLRVSISARFLECWTVIIGRRTRLYPAFINKEANVNCCRYTQHSSE